MLMECFSLNTKWSHYSQRSSAATVLSIGEPSMKYVIDEDIIKHTDSQIVHYSKLSKM